MATISRKHSSESDGISGTESFISISMKEAPVVKVLAPLVALMAGFAHPAFARGRQPFRNRIRHSETFVAGREICLRRPDLRLLKFGGVRQVIA
jgi:hypothetical protein